MTAEFKVTLIKDVVFAHEQGPDWAVESSGTYSYRLSHHVTLPFAPYIGLSVAYDAAKVNFEQGDKAKNDSVRHFSSGPIVAVEWDAGAGLFNCVVAAQQLGLEDDLGHVLWRVQRDHWFPDAAQALEIQEMISRWRMRQSQQENASNVCFSKDRDET